ncbi:aminotransferase class III-fold pyridoxal phosphate-dependent enzyme [uncultured Desulfosarcina sp.]|uniref:aminotransferase class III-fold pyridoxal phosphate-dependent enzyme n=1 Tax=uncultured Desulfosarcina sp. TaxID=218289 RepID=UPI0029C99446|nr:aminotransferase class III-fold pyridoxal phosphate-dependent enzyme [uncultured Desulfosarcina sp.]
MAQYNRIFKEGSIGVDAPRQYLFPHKIIHRCKSWQGTTGRRLLGERRPAPMVSGAFHRSRGGVCPRSHRRPPLVRRWLEEVDRHLDYLAFLIEHEGGRGRVASMIFEPVAGSNGLIPAPKGYLKGLRERCDKYDLFLIVDETMTDTGRTGRLLAVYHDGMVPDILIIGKALDAYFPMAATIFVEPLAREFQDSIFGFGQSFTPHALASAAALASLNMVTVPGFLAENENSDQIELLISQTIFSGFMEWVDDGEAAF